MAKLLEGIRVLDLTRYVSGPYCAMLLAQMGAEVIKIEKPGVGEDNRVNGPWKNGESLLFASYNLSKESLTLDTRSKEGLEILKELIKKSDVLIENYRPGTMEKMGLGFEEIHKINPKLILASISGFGQSGPYRERVCFDGIAQAMGGMIDSVFVSGGVRCTTGGNLGDVFGGVYCAVAIGMALYRRSVSGEGMHIDTDMYSSMLSLFSAKLADYKANGVIHAPMGYGPVANYKTSDGWVRIDAGTAAIFYRLATFIDNPVLLDPKYKEVKNRLEDNDLIVGIIQDWIGQKDTAEVVDTFNKAGIPIGVINDISMIYNDEHLRERNQIVNVHMDRVGEDIPYFAMPFRVGGMDMVYKDAPAVGENNADILGGILGYDKAKIDELAEKKII